MAEIGFLGLARRRKRRVKRGAGLMDWVNKAHDALKKSRIVSTAASRLGYKPFANAARSMGYSRRKRVKRGGGIMDWINTANDALKKTRLISTAASRLGFKPIANAAKALGYARRRRVSHKRGGAVYPKSLLMPGLMDGMARRRRVVRRKRGGSYSRLY